MRGSFFVDYEIRQVFKTSDSVIKLPLTFASVPARE
jgi:hypothetical protein